jgi:ribosomal protein S27AE
MIITELDKEGIRSQTAKLIRSGKLGRQRCEVCGASETLAFHADYIDPTHIRWLCGRHKGEERMSDLQRSLLRSGLIAHYYTPVHIAGSREAPGALLAPGPG